MDDLVQRIDEATHAHSVQALHIRTYGYGDEIIREGGASQYFYVILTGQVRISRQNKKVLLLGDQDIFGLEHLLFNRPCLYTAKSMTESRIAAYGQETLDYLFRESPRMTQNILASVLQQLAKATQSLLQGFEEIALDEVNVKFFDDGDIIMEEGTTGADFYRLVSTQGGLRVSFRGKEINRIEKPGDFFGEMAGLLCFPRQATISSIGESVVEVYSADQLDVIIRDYPEVALQIMRTLVSRLAEVNRKLTGSIG